MCIVTSQRSDRLTSESAVHASVDQLCHLIPGPLRVVAIVPRLHLRGQWSSVHEHGICLCPSRRPCDILVLLGHLQHGRHDGTVTYEHNATTKHLHVTLLPARGRTKPHLQRTFCTTSRRTFLVRAATRLATKSAPNGSTKEARPLVRACRLRVAS
jgi:hypothetical protein